MSLSVDQGQSSNPHREDHTVKVLYIGIAFTCMFSAFNSCQALAPEIFRQLGFDSLGQLTLLVGYSCFTISNIFVCSVTQYFNTKSGLICGSLGFIFLYLLQAFAVNCALSGDTTGFCSKTSIYIIIMLGASLLGLGNGLLWVFQAGYLNNCTHDSNIGELHGLFWSLCQGSLLIGALIGTVILSMWNQTAYFLCCVALQLIAIVMFAFLPDVPEKEKSLPPCLSFGDAGRAFLAHFTNKAELRFIPMLANTGFAFSFYSTILPFIIMKIFKGDSNKEVNEYTGLFVVTIGAAEFLVGFLFGRIIDKLNRLIYGMNSTMVLYQAAIVVSFAADYTGSYSWCLAAGAVWGAAECSNYVMCYAIIDHQFEGRSDMSTLLWACQGIFGGLAFLVTILLNGQPIAVTIFVWLLIQMIINPIVNSYHEKSD